MSKFLFLLMVLVATSLGCEAASPRSDGTPTGTGGTGGAGDGQGGGGSGAGEGGAEPGDRCSSSVRVGECPTCDDGNPCTVDGCDEGTCVHVAFAPGTACGAGEVCTLDAQCCEVQTLCTGEGTRGSCDDGELCLSGVCRSACDPDDRESCPGSACTPHVTADERWVDVCGPEFEIASLGPQTFSIAPLEEVRRWVQVISRSGVGEEVAVAIRVRAPAGFRTEITPSRVVAVRPDDPLVQLVFTPGEAVEPGEYSVVVEAVSDKGARSLVMAVEVE